MAYLSRQGEIKDAGSIAEIYNQGISERTATFETDLKTGSDIEKWFGEGDRRITVVTEGNGNVLSFATASPYSERSCYSGISLFSVYVHRNYRGKGIGKLTMERLILSAAEMGRWKLVSRIFPENYVSRRLMRNMGFREVGIYKNHGRLDGKWKDVVIVELLISENID
jgi:phosphinothricin acetyltransferase